MKTTIAFLGCLAVILLLQASPACASEALKHQFLRRILPVTQAPGNDPQHGGIDCISCTIAISMVEQLAAIHNKSVDDLLDDICDLFKEPVINEACLYLVDTYGADAIRYIDNKENPDQVCRDLGMCDGVCKLFPATRSHLAPRPPKSSSPLSNNKQRLARADARKRKGFDPWGWLKDLFARLENHKPLIDLDGDLFSTEDTLRGAYWRGKDCDDLSNRVYPGRKDGGGAADHNCNGIRGTDSATGKSWETKLCEGTNPLGTIVIGDSAAAHFHIPVPYLSPPLITETTYDHILDPWLMDELDWPHRNWGTGHLPDLSGNCPGPLDSIYLSQWRRNHCVFRDYQTLAVNGASSGNVIGNHITDSISRNQTTDHPVLLFYALIGNDVCHPEHGLQHMTTPEQFEKNVLESLTYLDNVLPSGSHIVFEGLANGSFLYAELHNRHYPLSPEITYRDVYDYLDCLHLAPCWVWMNANASIRDAGTNRAFALSAIYPKIIQKYKFKNFDMAYIPFPLAQVAKQWKAEGGEIWQLIEPLDGFHPNQIFQALEAKTIWNWLLQEHPTFVTGENPNNKEIESRFGNQGGY